jgi:hypothetical protein|tara:strand:- start:2071 stop:2202 length:132 start_codon:yes stop_codon:yes gene_type:complete
MQRIHWKTRLPSFFYMDLKELSSDLGDWEYLSNPEGYELNPEQ